MKTRIKNNIEAVLKTLPTDVTLCAVTKYHSIDETRAVIDAGIMDLGENKVQDLLAKQAIITDPNVRWHLIGHLQTNKVKKVISHTALIHSVDSLRLVEVIERESAVQNVLTHILLQINLTGEETKTGLSLSELSQVLEMLPHQAHIVLRGIMGMGALGQKPEENRKIFKTLKEIYDTIREAYLNGQNQVDTLSMGMTDDYPDAVAEGATIVRIGRKIFE